MSKTTDTQIIAVEIFQSRIRLKEPFIISLGAFFYAENILVRISAAGGLTGIGEGSPFMSIHGESMETCFIVGQYLAKALLGKNALQMADCIATMDQLIYGNACVKSAFDMALHDISAQHCGLPLYVLLGGSNNRLLRTDYTISLDKPEKMAADAIEIINRGFEEIKVKLGGNWEEDIVRIRRIREAIGPLIPLRIDANQGWTPQTALQLLKALEKENITFCEEPVPRWDFMSLPALRQQSPIPIMADESCCDEHDAGRLIEIGACDAFNIKLGKSGIYKAQKIIRLAENAGLRLQLGGFLESRLGFTASAHLALSSSSILYCDFDTPLMFEEDPVKGGITYGAGGTISVPDSIGLGAGMEEAYLEGLKKIVIN